MARRNGLTKGGQAPCYMVHTEPETRTIPSSTAFLKIIEEINRAGTGWERWPFVLSGLAQFLGGIRCTLAVSGVPAAASDGCSAIAADPWLTALAELETGAVTVMQLPSHNGATLELLIGAASRSTGLMVEAPLGMRFTPGAARSLQRLLPLLELAVRSSRSSYSDAIEVLDQMAFGVLVLDADGTLRIANARGAALLTAAGLGFENRRLRGRSGAATVHLRHHVALAAAGSCYAERLPPADGHASLQLALLPLQPGRATALLTGAEADAVTNPLPLQPLLGITRGQARLAALLADGFSLRDAAGRLGITYGTAITQLKKAYARTGVGSQAALVRLVLTGPSALIAASAIAAAAELLP